MLIQTQTRTGTKVSTFQRTTILEELRETKPNQFYIYFSKIIDLNKLHNSIMKHWLDNDNKVLEYQSNCRRYMKKSILTFNKFGSRVIYRDDSLAFTINFSKGGCIIYPNVNQGNSFSKSIKFIKVLEEGNYLS